MQNVNLHQQRLIALVIALVAIIAMFLTWSSSNYSNTDENYNTVNISSSENGFSSTGFLSLVGIIGVIASSLLGDRMKAFEGQIKMIALGSFAVIILGAILYLIIAHGSGIGLWLELIAGIIGGVLVSGILAMKGTGTQGSSTPTSGTPPTPPPHP